MKTKIAAGVGLAVFCAGVAVAAGHAGKSHDGKMHHGMMADAPKTRAEVEAKVKEHFAAMDANKDGSVTVEERGAARQAKMAEMKDGHFKAMDTNSDGSISRAEFDAGHSASAGAHGGMGHKAGLRGGRGGGGRDGGRDGARRDTDGNGKLTLAEALAGPLARFDRIDTDKDGALSDKEREAARDARKDRRMKWRDSRG
jgi:Ca2+-binding EF-hand superfamily protein